ncbi:MAG: hypothetical protein WD801_05750 [Gemmatimonadaceae bacterium]
MRSRAFAVVSLAVAAVSVLACRDIPAPEGGVLSVSRVLLPSPGLVVGDTMRDSTGAAAPLAVIAYGISGQPLSPQPDAAFHILGAGAHLAGALLVGDEAGTRVGLVASVGALQTLPESVTVTLRPDTLIAADSTRHVRRYALIGDTVINSAELSTIVQHREGADTSGVDAVIVRYEIVSAPTATGSGPTVQLMRVNAPSSRDTTSGGGRASRSARLRIAAFAGALDSAVVLATASNRGATLGSVRFTIVFQQEQE